MDSKKRARGSGSPIESDLLSESQAHANAGPAAMRLELASPAASGVEAMYSPPASALTEVSALVTKHEVALVTRVVLPR
jgi:hypothetical protein